MKTYYFIGHWEDAWECGDGCCSGGNEWIINFSGLEIDGEQINDFVYSGGTCYSLKDVFLSVFEQENGDFAPECVSEEEEKDAYNRWLEEDLTARDIFVNVLLEGQK